MVFTPPCDWRPAPKDLKTVLLEAVNCIVCFIKNIYTSKERLTTSGSDSCKQADTVVSTPAGVVWKIFFGQMQSYAFLQSLPYLKVIKKQKF